MYFRKCTIGCRVGRHFALSCLPLPMELIKKTTGSLQYFEIFLDQDLKALNSILHSLLLTPCWAPFLFCKNMELTFRLNKLPTLEIF